MFQLTIMLETLINVGIISAFVILIYDFKNYSKTTHRMNIGFYFFKKILNINVQLFIVYFFKGWIIIFSGFSL